MHAFMIIIKKTKTFVSPPGMMYQNTNYVQNDPVPVNCPPPPRQNVYNWGNPIGASPCATD